MLNSNNTAEASNLFEFPKSRIKRDHPQGYTTEEEAQKELLRLKKLKYALIREYLSLLIPPLFNTLYVSGFEINEIQQSKDGALIVEAVRSFIEKQMKIEHPLQTIAQVMFDMDSENGSLTMVKGFSITEVRDDDEDEPIEETKKEENEESTIPNS